MQRRVWKDKVTGQVDGGNPMREEEGRKGEQKEEEQGEEEKDEEEEDEEKEEETEKGVKKEER